MSWSCMQCSNSKCMAECWLLMQACSSSSSLGRSVSTASMHRIVAMPDAEQPMDTCDLLEDLALESGNFWSNAILRRWTTSSVCRDPGIARLATWIGPPRGRRRRGWTCRWPLRRGCTDGSAGCGSKVLPDIAVIKWSGMCAGTSRSKG